jgi:uncharacterized membrane protein YhhN
VTAIAAVALVLAALFAVGDWVAKATENRRLEYLCKPATLAFLIVVAATLDPAADASTRRAWFVAALVFSLAGDVLLMLPRDLFVAGLAAFLAGHLCYVAGFWSQDAPTIAAFVVAVAIVVAVLAPVLVRILGAVRGTPDLVPVTAYSVVIAVMLASAIASGNVVAALGATLFVASDSMIAWDRFVRPFPAAGVAIMVTYHLGQAGLVLSLLR